MALTFRKLHPLFVAELAYASHAAWATPRPLGSLAELVGQRVAALPARARLLLVTTVVAGTPLAQGLLRETQELAQAIQGTVNDGDVSTQADSHFGRMFTRYAATEDDDLRRLHTGNTTQQDAKSTVRLLQAGSANLNRHTAGNFAHRGQ